MLPSVIPVWLELALVALAIARLTVLLRADRITKGLRDGVRRVTEPESLPRYLMTCSWCLSIWIGALAALAWYFWHGRLAFDAVALALAGSYVAGALSGAAFEPDSDEPAG